MKRSIIKRNNYTISFVKTNKFNNCSINVLFKQKLDANKITINSLLVDCLSYSCNKYPTKNLLQRELERLYDASIDSTFYKVGNEFFQNYCISFLNPKYCDEGYVKDVVTLLMEVIFKPNIKNNKFDEDTFNISKKKYEDTLIYYRESASYVANVEALKLFSKDTMTRYIEDGNIEDLQKVTNEDLVKAYNNLINNSDCNIYVIGNFNKSDFLSIVDNYFSDYKNKNIKDDLYVKNEEKKEVLSVEKSGPFKQDSLFVFYNFNIEDKRDKYIVASVFNNIFSTGSLNSKLYKRVREENSLCYTIYASYHSFDNYISVYAGINKKDKEKCLKLIDECLEEMIQGKFSDKDVKDAIKSMMIRIKSRKGTSSGIMNEYVSIDNFDSYEDSEKIQLLKTVTKNDVMRVAKLMKKNLVYLLYGEEENAKD